MSTFVKSVLFVVVVSCALVGCGNSNNVMDTLRNVAQENFLPDAGGPLDVAIKDTADRAKQYFAAILPGDTQSIPFSNSWDSGSGSRR
jgi:hypothetical protein